MSTFEGSSIQPAEVSESALEYLLGEILSLSYFNSADDKPIAGMDNSELEFIKLQRLDELGYNVGFR